MEFTTRADRAGKLAEALVAQVFGLSEPAIEVKASCRKDSRVIVKLSQLERQIELDYVIVVYDRGRRETRTGKEVSKLSIEDAFKQPCEFIVLPGYQIARIIHDRQCRIRFVNDPHNVNGKFSADIPLGKLREGKTNTVLQSGHSLFGNPPQAKADKSGNFFTES